MCMGRVCIVFTAQVKWTTIFEDLNQLRIALKTMVTQRNCKHIIKNAKGSKR